MGHDLFVSYSVKDKLVADAIVARLEAEEIRCWVAPRDVVPGADWGESIINAIESSRIMVLVFTSSANASPQIKREVERAVDKGIYTIPFRVDNIEPTRALEYFISTSQWMDAFVPPLEAHLDSLAKTVKAILTASPPLPSPIPAPQPRPTPPIGSRRWLWTAAALALAGGVAWYFSAHGTVNRVNLAEVPVAMPSPISSQPTPNETGADERDLLARQAKEKEKREAALKAQLAETQEQMEKMRETAQQQRDAIGITQNEPWLLPDSSARYLSPNELASFNSEQLWRARNEIYARHGYLFSSPKGVAFARLLGPNYHGVDSDETRVFERMNPFEQANVNLIKSLEQR